MSHPATLMFPSDSPIAKRWRPIPELRVGLNANLTPSERARALQFAGQALNERFMDEPRVRWARSVRLQRVPYPAWYAFNGVHAQQQWLGGMIHLAARLLIVPFVDFEGVLRTLLFNPHDIEHGVETPFFKRLSAPLPRYLASALAPIDTTVHQALAELGISPQSVDYIAYDHLHTQDLRQWFGDGHMAGVFPNAKLLVHQSEWQSIHGLLPTQADWYCPQGAAGIPRDRVFCFEGSIQLGQGLALVHTPGHTAGNCSIVYRAPDGIRVSSENGVSSDSWYPHCSSVNAIRRYAKATGSEVILNGNTQESSVDQYLSMILERSMAGQRTLDQIGTVLPSSEATPHWLFRGAPQTHIWGDVNFGQCVKTITD